jgi:hypothetical protein
MPSFSLAEKLQESGGDGRSSPRLVRLSSLHFRFDYLSVKDRGSRHDEGEANASIANCYLIQRQILVRWRHSGKCFRCSRSSLRQHILA